LIDPVPKLVLIEELLESAPPSKAAVRIVLGFTEGACIHCETSADDESLLGKRPCARKSIPALCRALDHIDYVSQVYDRRLPQLSTWPMCGVPSKAGDTERTEKSHVVAETAARSALVRILDFVNRDSFLPLSGDGARCSQPAPWNFCLYRRFFGGQPRRDTRSSRWSSRPRRKFLLIGPRQDRDTWLKIGELQWVKAYCSG
jgi:hypothetical protein